jgi:hypothetical protein
MTYKATVSPLLRIRGLVLAAGDGILGHVSGVDRKLVQGQDCEVWMDGEKQKRQSKMEQAFQLTV